MLLFRFVFTHGALAGQDFWATPGGALEPGETFEEAARRELLEETGIVAGSFGERVAEREFVLPMPDGGSVVAEERFYVVRASDPVLSRDGWTALEQEVMVNHRWWAVEDLMSTHEVVFPENLVEILATVGVGARTQR